MKTAFITIHVGFNFGSVLQTIATSHLLRRHGMEPICVNYIPPRATFKRYWEDGIGNVKKMVRRFLFFPFSNLNVNNSGEKRRQSNQKKKETRSIEKEFKTI